MTEAQFQSAIVELARLLGYRVAHFRAAKTAHGWRTPVAADGAGWPDLTLAKPGRLLFVECKSAARPAARRPKGVALRPHRRRRRGSCLAGGRHVDAGRRRHPPEPHKHGCRMTPRPWLTVAEVAHQEGVSAADDPAMDRARAPSKHADSPAAGSGSTSTGTPEIDRQSGVCSRCRRRGRRLRCRPARWYGAAEAGAACGRRRTKTGSGVAGRRRRIERKGEAAICD